MNVKFLRQGARLFHEGALALAKMESNGVRVDVPYLDEKIKSVGEDIRERQRRLRNDEVYEEWRKRFADRTKLGSKEQLATVIFDCMGHPRKRLNAKKTRTEDEDSKKRESKWSEEAFSHIDLPFLKDYFACEKLKKLKSTYLEGIKREVTPAGFVHPFFNLHTVVSYRSSSNAPNWQNNPARNKSIAEIIRRCFIPRKGRHLVENDFGGIEVRVACCYTHDKQLIKEFTGPDGDPHGDTARELFFLKGYKPKDAAAASAWKKGPRDWSKNRFVFPEFYGSVYFQCAPDLWEGVIHCEDLFDGKTILQHLKANGITKLGNCEPGADVEEGTFVWQVKQVEDSFWNDRFKRYTEWKKEWYAAYLKTGGFDVLTGFRIEGMLAKNDVLNYGIQAAAFHCELWSIIEIQKALEKYKMDSVLIGEIHDCDNADVTPREIQDYLDIVTEIKEVKLPKHWPWIVVPLTTEAEICPIDQPWPCKAVWEKNSVGVWGAKK